MQKDKHELLRTAIQALTVADGVAIVLGIFVAAPVIGWLHSDPPWMVTAITWGFLLLVGVARLTFWAWDD